MLFVPRQTYQAFSYDNWGANPATTIGTSVIPSSPGNEGAWFQVASAANISQDIYGFYLIVHSGATAGNIKLHLLDVGVDPAGGTAYTEVIQNLVCGNSGAITVAGVKDHFFPFYIKAGSSVAVRMTGSNATVGTVRVAARFYGQFSNPSTLPVGTFSESYGATQATASGTSITPGNAADGTWTQVGTTTNPIWWWQLGYQINNTTITAEYTYLELGVGDATNKFSVYKVMHGGTTGETNGIFGSANLMWHNAYYPVPGGTNVYVRARCNNAPDTGYQVGVIGIGG
jgi:hypothetical protein